MIKSVNHFFPSQTDSSLTAKTLPADSFLRDVHVYRIDEAGQLIDAFGAPEESVVAAAIASGTAEISIASEDNQTSSATIAIPVHKEDRVSSVAVLSSKKVEQTHDKVVGVFEVWEPVGLYQELALKAGFYGKMERFRNVSSFVRFEKGNGLPGQVWQERTGVIHDDLSNHPGFLRAAGASADLLITGIGLPVASHAYHSSVLLLSSGVSPLARGFEIWQATSEQFTLLGGAYRGMPAMGLPAETRLAIQEGLPGLASVEGAAVLSDNPDILFAGRPTESRPESACGLAIPCYDGDSLTSVATLLF